MKKGLSPIISIMLLLLIAVSMATMAIMFLPKYTTQVTENVVNDVSYARTRACLNIESVEAGGVIVIKNCGKIPLSGFKVYIDGVSSGAAQGPLGTLSTMLMTTSSFTPGRHSVLVTSDYAESPVIEAYFSEAPPSTFIMWVLPTPANGALLPSSWAYLNTTLSGASDASSFIDFDRTLLGYWPMDYYDASGVFDNSTRSSFCSFQGGMTSSSIVSGRYGSASNFGNAAHSLNCGNSGDLQLPGQFTIEAWIYPRSFGGSSFGRIVDKGSMLFYVAADAPNGLRVYSNGGAFQSSSSANSVSLNSWQHVAVVYNGTHNNFYVNGVSRGRVAEASLPSVGTSSLYIGNSGSGTRNFDGMIDEVRIWNRTLSEQEILASYSSAANRLYRNFTNLANGNYQYYARSVDAKGGFYSTETRGFTVGVAAPYWFDSSVNNTIAARLTKFSLGWGDAAGLSGFIFSTNNSGSWSNDTWRRMTGIGNWSNITKTLNAAVGTTVQWRVFANNTNGIWTASDVFSLTTTSSVSAPRYTNSFSSGTDSGTLAMFSMNWTSDTGLSGFIFSTNNSGVWSNTTYVARNYSLNILASYSADGNSGSYWPSDGDDGVGDFSGNDVRLAQTYDIGSIPAGAVINSVRLRVKALATRPGAAGSNVDVHLYGGSIGYSPQSDSASTFYSRCSPSAIPYINDGTMFVGSTGLIWLSLGTQAASDVQAARAAGYGFSISMHEEGDDAIGTVVYEVATASGDQIPLLEINYTVYENANFVQFGASTWSNTSMVLNSNPGTAVAWCFYANDTSNSWNRTSCDNPFILTTTGLFGIKPSILTLFNGTRRVNNSGLVGYWPFDEGAGMIAYDRAGDSDGSINGNPMWTSARIGKAIKVDGVGDNIYIGDDPAFDMKSEFTISLWLTASNYPALSYERVLEKGVWTSGGERSSYRIARDIDEPRYALQVYNTTSNIQSCGFLGWQPLTIGRTYHFVGTYTPTEIRCYVDGVLTDIGYVRGGIQQTVDPFVIGSNSAGGENFNGTIDEVQIWNRSISAAEVAELYRSTVTSGTRTNFTMFETNIGDSDVSYDFYRNGTVSAIWRFDEGLGLYAFDETGNNNTAAPGNSSASNRPSWTSNCKFGSCLRFDGGDRLNLTSLSLDLNVFSVETWIYPTSNQHASNGVIYKSGGQSASPYIEAELALTSDRRLHWCTNNGFVQCNDSAAVVPINQWSHVVGTYDGSRLISYINGAVVGNQSVGGTITKLNNRVIIGAGEISQYFNGTIDELKVYPRALSTKEVLCRYGNNCSAYGYWNETATLPRGYYFYTASSTGGAGFTPSMLRLPLNVT